MPNEPNPDAPPVKDESAVIAKAVEGVLAKYGDPNSALRVLLTENHGYRDEIRDLKAKAPVPGSTVLDADAAKQFNQYRELGDVKDVRTAFTERDEFKSKATGYEQERHFANVAEKSRLNPKVLTDLARRDGLDIEIVTKKDTAGKEFEVALVKGEGDARTPLIDHAKKQWPDYAAVLFLDAAKTALPPGTPPRNNPSPRPLSSDQHDERAALMATGRYAPRGL